MGSKVSLNLQQNTTSSQKQEGLRIPLEFQHKHRKKHKENLKGNASITIFKGNNTKNVESLEVAIFKSTKNTKSIECRKHYKHKVVNK
jgi:hypothetical protein